MKVSSLLWKVIYFVVVMIVGMAVSDNVYVQVSVFLLAPLCFLLVACAHFCRYTLARLFLILDILAMLLFGAIMLLFYFTAGEVGAYAGLAVALTIALYLWYITHDWGNKDVQSLVVMLLIFPGSFAGSALIGDMIVGKIVGVVLALYVIGFVVSFFRDGAEVSSGGRSSVPARSSGGHSGSRKPTFAQVQQAVAYYINSDVRVSVSGDNHNIVLTMSCYNEGARIANLRHLQDYLRKRLAGYDLSNIEFYY